MKPFTSQEIEELRADTPGAAQRLHFNNAGAALVPGPVLDAMRDHLELEARIGGYEAAAAARPAWRAFYEAVGRLLRCPAQNVAYCTSATDAYNRALSSLPFAPGDTLLTTRHDYASNQIAFLQLRKRFGVEVRWAENGADGVVDPDDMRRLMDAHRPRLVALTHVPSGIGLVQPAAEVGRLCAERGILYLVDACQSVGQIDLDVADLRCDFLSGTLRKFLRGPRGAGFLYASDRVLADDMEPLYLDLHSARWTGPETYEAAPSARRFELWEKAYAGMLGAREAIDYATDLGLDRIEARVQGLAEGLRNRLRERERVRVLDRGPVSCGIISFTVSGTDDAQPLHQALMDRGINTAFTGPGNARFIFPKEDVPWVLRASPHYYNTEEEVDRFLEVLDSILEQ